MINKKTHSCRQSKGAILLVSLILLLAMTMIGVATIDSSSLQSQMSRNSLEALTRHQVTMNEIQGQYKKSEGWQYREAIRHSATSVPNTHAGVTYSGPGLLINETLAGTLTTPDLTDPYELSGYMVFSGASTAAFHGYSLNKNRVFSYEVNIITTLTGSQSTSDQTQGISHMAPPE